MVDFRRYHPIVNIIFLLNCIFIIAVIENIMCQVICFTAIKIMLFYYKNDSKIRFNLIIDVIVIISATTVNVLFNHQGATIISYFKSGNPLTLESIIYGIYSGFMFVNILNLCIFINIILNSEKILYLLGRLSPKLALIFTMSLQYFEKFKRKLVDVINSRKNLYFKENFAIKLQKTLKSISILLSWALESAIDTSNSMKNRGYGASKRTCYKRYRILNRDLVVLCMIISLIVVNWYIYFKFSVKNTFFPVFSLVNTGVSTVLFQISLILFISIPIFLIVGEKIKWK